MHKSPWSYYGRGPVRPEISARATAQDPAFGPLPVVNGQEKLAIYLHGALSEYSKIRSGPAGYRKLIDAVLRPPKRPESIEDTLRRLAGESDRGAQSRES
jgi:hypothetical protein